MNKTQTIRTARRLFNLQEWLDKKSESYSMLCGEDFTHKEVLIANIMVLALIGVCVLAEAMKGGIS